MNSESANGAGTEKAIQPKPASKLPACADCKRLKVKCVRSDPDNPSSPCLHCIKKRLECIYGSSLKRPSNNEKKTGERRNKRKTYRRDGDYEPMDSLTMRDQLLSAWKLLTSRDDLRLTLLEKYDFISLARPSNNVLDRGLFTRDDIVRRLKLYREELYQKVPVVECPVEDDFEEMMRTSPVLFHTILDISSLMVSDQSQLEPSLILHNLVLRTVIDEIMIVSVKNLELLKCLVLLTHWYNESELYHQQRLHVLTSLAVSVSYDLGMGGTAVVTPGSNAPVFEQMVAPQAAADINNPEYYRIWLAVYSVLFQSLAANRRPVNSLWNKYTEQAVLRLSTDELLMSNDPPSFDVWELAWLRHLQERIALTVFKKDNEPIAPNYNDPDIQYQIQQFDDELSNLKNTGPPSSNRRDLALNLSRIFLHQAVLYTEYDETLGRAPFTNFSLNMLSGPLSYGAIKSFTTCVQCSKQTLEEVTTLPSKFVASETSSFWASLTMCCDVILKCRACCIFNRFYAAACFVTEEDVRLVTKFNEMCDRMIKEYPNCNNAVSFGFFVRLLICYHDARVHYQLNRVPVESLGDPVYVMRMANSTAALEADPDVVKETNSDSREIHSTNDSMMSEDNTRGDLQCQQATPLSTENTFSSSNTVVPKPVYAMQGKQQPMPLSTVSAPPNPDLSGGEMNKGGQQQYIASPFSPISIDVNQPQPQSQPQQYEMNVPPLEADTLGLDAAALNEIDSFWTDLVNTGRNSGPFGLDFPV